MPATQYTEGPHPVMHRAYGAQQPALRSWKDYKAVTRDLKAIYQAPTKRQVSRHWKRSLRPGTVAIPDKPKLAG